MSNIQLSPAIYLRSYQSIQPSISEPVCIYSWLFHLFTFSYPPNLYNQQSIYPAIYLTSYHSIQLSYIYIQLSISGNLSLQLYICSWLFHLFDFLLPFPIPPCCLILCCQILGPLELFETAINPTAGQIERKFLVCCIIVPKQNLCHQLINQRRHCLRRGMIARNFKLTKT